MNDTVDIPQLIAEVITEVQTIAEGRGVHVTARNLAGMPRWVEVDEGELRRLLLNLLDIVVGTATDGTVTVRMESRDAGRDLWTFVVEWRSDQDAVIEEMRCTFATVLPPSPVGAVERPLEAPVMAAEPAPRQTLSAARQELATALAAGPDVQMERLRLLGKTLKTTADERGLGDIAHLAAALEQAAAAGLERDAVTAARTLRAWLARAL